MRRCLLLSAAAGASGGSTTLEPSDVSGLVQWFRAESLSALADGATVSAWQSSGPLPAALLSAPGDSFRPTLVKPAVNGLPALRFNGTTNALSGGVSLSGTALTVVAVCRRTGGGNEGRLFSLTPASGSDKTQDSAAHVQADAGTPLLWSGIRNGKDPRSPRLIPSGWHVVGLRWSASDGSLWVNRASGLPVSSTSTPFAVTSMGIGQSGNSPADWGFFGGDVAEVAVYSRALSNQEMTALIGGLISKYAIDAPTASAPILASVSLDADLGSWRTRTSVSHYPISESLPAAIATRLSAYGPPAMRIPVSGSLIPLTEKGRSQRYGSYEGGYPPYEAWSFSTLDTAIVEDKAASGSAPMLWLAEVPAIFPRTTDSSNLSAIAQCLGRILSYYNLGQMQTAGGITVANPYGTTNRITYWELFPRPSDVNFPMNQIDYSRTFDAVAPVLRAIDPTVKLVLTPDDTSYISAVVSGAWVPDFFGIRLSAGATSAKDYQLAASLTDAGGIDATIHAALAVSGGVPLLVTESNLFLSSTIDTSSRAPRGLGQAWNADAFGFSAVGHQSTPHDIETIYTWNLFENDQFGLLDTNGAPYRSYWRNLLLNRYFPVGSTVLATSSSLPRDVGVSAIRRPDGDISVLVVNRRFDDVVSVGGSGLTAEVTVDVGGAIAEQVQAQVITGTTPTATEPETTSLATVQPRITLPGYGFGLLRFSSEPVGVAGFWKALLSTENALDPTDQSASEWSWWGQTEPNRYGYRPAVAATESLGLPPLPRVAGVQPVNCLAEHHTTNATGQVNPAEQTNVYGDYPGIGFGLSGHTNHGVLKRFTDANWPSGTEPTAQPDYINGSPDDVSGRYLTYTYLSPTMTIPPNFSVSGIGGLVREDYRDGTGHTTTPHWGFEIDNMFGPENGFADGTLVLSFAGWDWRGTPVLADPFLDRWVKWEIRVYQGERVEAYADDRLLWIKAQDATNPVGRCMFQGLPNPLSATVLAEEGWVYGVGAFLDPSVIVQDFAVFVGPTLLLPLP